MTSMPAGRGASWSSSAPHEREGGVVGRHLLPLSETFLSASASSSLTYRLPSAGRKGKKTKRAEERKKRGGRREKEDGLNTLPFAVPLFMEVEEEEEKNTKIVSGEQVGQGSTRWIREKEKSRTMADAWQALDWLQHIVKREEYGVESIDTKWKEPKRSMDGEGEDEGEERGGPMPSSSAVSSSLRTTLRWGKSAYAVLSVLDEIMCFGDVQHGRAPLVEEKGKKMAVARASLSHPPPPPHLPVPNRSERSGGGAERHCGSSLVALAERNAPVSYCCSLPLQLYGMYFYGSADLLPSSLRAESFFRMQREEEEEVGKRKKMGGKPVREGVMSPAWLEGKGNEMEVDDNLPAYTNDPSCEKRRLPSTTTTPTAFFWRRVKGRHAVQNAFWKDHNSPVGLPHLPPSPSLTNGGIQSHSLSAASFSSSTSFQWASHVLSRWIRSSGDEFCALPPSFRYRPVPSPPPSSSSLLVLAEGRSFPTPWPPSSSSVFDAYWTQLFFIYESMMVESVAIAAGAAAAAAASMFPSSSPHPDLLRHNASDEEGKDFGVVKKSLYHAAGVLLVLHRIISAVSSRAPSSPSLSASFSSASSERGEGEHRRRTTSNRRQREEEGHFFSPSCSPTRGAPMTGGLQPLLALHAQFAGGSPLRDDPVPIRPPLHSGASPPQPPPRQHASLPPPTPPSPSPAYSPEHRSSSSNEKDRRRADHHSGGDREWWRWSAYWRRRLLEGYGEGMAMPLLWYRTVLRRPTGSSSSSTSAWSSFREYAALWREVVRTDCVLLLSIGHASEKADDLREWVAACANLPVGEEPGEGRNCRKGRMEKMGALAMNGTLQEKSPPLMNGRGEAKRKEAWEKEGRLAWQGEKSLAQVFQLFADVQHHVRVLQHLQTMGSFSPFDKKKKSAPTKPPLLPSRKNAPTRAENGGEEEEVQRGGVREKSSEAPAEECWMRFLAAHLSPGVITSLLTRAQEALRVSTKYFLVWCTPPSRFSSFSTSTSSETPSTRLIGNQMEPTHRKEPTERETGWEEDLGNQRRMEETSSPSLSSSPSVLSWCQTRIRAFLSQHLSASPVLPPPHPPWILSLPPYLCESMDVGILLGALQLWNASLYCCETLMRKRAMPPPRLASSSTSIGPAAYPTSPRGALVSTTGKAARRAEEANYMAVAGEQTHEPLAAVQAVHRLLHSIRFRHHLSQSIREAAKELFLGLAQGCHDIHNTPTDPSPLLGERSSFIPDENDAAARVPHASSFFSPHRHDDGREEKMQGEASRWLRYWRQFLAEHIDACRGVVPPAVVVHLAVEGALESGVRPPHKWEEEEEEKKTIPTITASTTESANRCTGRSAKKKRERAWPSVCGSSFSSLPWGALLLSQYTHPGEADSSPFFCFSWPLSPPPLLSKTALLVLEEVTKEVFLSGCSSSMKGAVKTTRNHESTGKGEPHQKACANEDIDFSFFPSISPTVFSLPPPLSTSMPTFLSYWSALLWRYPLLSPSLFTGITECWLMEDRNRKERKAGLDMALAKSRRRREKGKHSTELHDDEIENQAPETEDKEEANRFHSPLPSSSSIRPLYRHSWTWRREMKWRLEMEEKQKKKSRLAATPMPLPIMPMDSSASQPALEQVYR